MKLLLGATVALLLGALAVSWQGMNNGVKNASTDDVARLKKQVEELRQQQDTLDLQRKLQDLKATTPPTPTPAANAAEIEAVKAQLEQNKAALAKIEEEKAKRDKQLAIDEEGLIARTKLESTDKELGSARMIADALLIGRVKEYIEDAQFGGFITFEVLMKEQVQVGTVLAIRRNKTGMLGQFKVSEVTAEGAIANPLPGFGPIVPKVGDELIFPPQF
ncbi:MAG: hypothetical protein WCS43_07380 [Verrucomicrobiota bacterium]